MKKFSIAVVAIALVLTLVCFAACGSDLPFDEINKALHSDYSAVTVTVRTERDGIQLGGVFKVTFSGEKATVEYAYDKLNELSVSGGNPDEYLSTVTGSAQVENGALSDGSVTEDLNIGQLDYTGFSFKAGFFDDVQLGDNELVAKVSNPKGFVGNNRFECSDMTVTVTFTDQVVDSLYLQYVSQAGAQVKVTYAFGA